MAGSARVLTNGCDVHIATASSSKEKVHPNTTLYHLIGCLLPARMFSLKEFLLAVGVVYLPIIATE